MEAGELLEKIEADPRNAAYTAKGLRPLFQLHEQAKILLIGQAPGKKVEESGVLFQDASGDRLRQWLGVDKETFYSTAFAILPMDFYYPGKGKSGDLPPRKFIASDYHPELLARMPDIQLTLLIGQYAVRYYLKGRMKKNLTETVRSYQDYLPACLPLVHPSPLNFRWQAKNPWFEAEVVPALQERVGDILSEA